jgi:hypothetical protein
MPVLRVPEGLFQTLQSAFAMAASETDPAGAEAPIRRDVVLRIWQEFALAEAAHLPGLPLVMEVTPEEAGALVLAFRAETERPEAVGERAWTQLRELLAEAEPGCLQSQVTLHSNTDDA